MTKWEMEVLGYLEIMKILEDMQMLRSEEFDPSWQSRAIFLRHCRHLVAGHFIYECDVLCNETYSVSMGTLSTSSLFDKQPVACR